MQLLRVAPFCVYRFVVCIDSLLEIVSSRNVLQLSHSHHFIRVKARKNSFGFLNAVPGKNDVGVSALILIDLPVFKNVGSSSEQRNLSTLRIIG